MTAVANSALPYGRQWLDDEDIRLVVEALHSDWLTTGPCVEAFEKALADYCGAKHVIAVANGTAALHVAMLAAGIKAGNRVLTSANTFLASANCAEFVGATADFADIDSKTCNVTPDTLNACWKDDVRAIVPVDFAGQPCDMPAIATLARERGAVIIEDASHAIGSQFEYQSKWHRVGGHAWADMTTFSFHPVKTITTGEGGAIMTNDDRLAERCRLFRNHGMVKEPSRFVGLSSDSGSSDPVAENSTAASWYYEMQELGYNYRITDLQCALGFGQLKKLDRFVSRRAEIVAAYNKAFASLPAIQCPSIEISSRPAWHLYVLQIDFSAIGTTRSQIMDELRRLGVGTQVHYIPVHLQPYYRRCHGYGAGKCPVAEAYYSRCLSLPLFPAMTDADVERVITAVKRVLIEL